MTPLLEKRCPACGATVNQVADAGDLCAACLMAEALVDDVADDFGPYRVLRPIGEGGMAMVYLAEQTHPLRRIVALKVVKPGLDTRQLIQRFDAERQTLAAMDHPHIARIYDAGSTLLGRPYFSMEHVEGEPIGDFCDSRQLRIEARLELFAQVCAAVDHAHSRGVVHRDIKPSNVLVGEVDGRPFPKVIDFGIARAMNLEDFEATRLTRAGQFLGTPQFMSPEQFAGGAQDARSDIYSLGLLLYELLAGTLPFDAAERRRDSEAATASRRFSLLGERAEAVARLRGEDARSLRGRLRGDLDAILCHALEREPALRYQSAGELAADVRRFQRNEPVLARRGFAYRMWKRARRRGRAIAAVAFGAAALTGLVWAIWYAERQKQAVAALSEVTEVIPLATAEGDEVSPSFAPDGSRVVYAWNGPRQDNFDLYLLDGPGRVPARLTTNPLPDYAPAWSPDGQWIAFMRGMPDGKASVMLRDVEGSVERLLMSGVHNTDPREMALDWSPDSRWLVTYGNPGDGLRDGILLISVETGDKRRLTTPEAEATDLQASFSADGRSLAFTREDRRPHSHICVLPLTADMRPAGPLRTLVTPGLENRLVHQPRFAPGGRDLLIVAARRFWSVPLDGSGAARPHNALGDNPRTLAFSSQGSLAFAREVYDPNIWKMDLAASASATRILASAEWENSPAVSPDGRQVAFASSRTGKMLIWVSELDGGHARSLSEWQGGSPQWSPDGAEIVFDSREYADGDICVVSSQGGTPRRLTDGSRSNVLPVWSQDGKWLYFSSRRLGENQIWRIPASGGAAEPITSSGGMFALPSLDGRWIYYSKSRTEVTSLWRVPVAGGAEEKVLDGIPWMRGFACGRTGIYFLQATFENRVRTLRFYETATGKVRDLHRFDRRVEDLALRPDEAGILYTQVDRDGMDLFLAKDFR